MPGCCHLRAQSREAMGWFFPGKMHHGDVLGPEFLSRGQPSKFRTESSLCGAGAGEVLAFCSEFRETLQFDTVTCFSGPKSVLILFAYC